MDSISEARSEPVVSVRGLVRRYGSHEAVAGIDLKVQRGEIFAFLGPNGAGKDHDGRPARLIWHGLRLASFGRGGGPGQAAGQGA